MSKKDVILSIVIANYNYGRFLPSAIESIIHQCDEPVSVNGRVALPIKGTDKKLELIICDALSSDDSVDVIKRYARHITWWCSEKDGGQSAAFNKGYSYANGEWLTWLNADEEFMPGTFKALCEKIRRNKGALWISGNSLRFDVRTRKITFVAWGPHCQPSFLKGNRACLSVFAPSSFISLEAYRKIGPINEAFHYSMDLEYWARMTLAGIRQTRLNYICWAFGVHPDSVSQGNMSPQKIAEGRAENVARRDALGYTYEISLRNMWYLIWLLMRILDGSMFMRLIMRWRLVGKRFVGCMGE